MRTVHLVDPPCGAEPDGEALFVRWPEVVTCPVCRATCTCQNDECLEVGKPGCYFGSVNNLMGYNT